MQWINSKMQVPEDDQDILCINCNVAMLPMKAYYCAEWNEFISLDTLGLTTLSITHWMPIPKSPEE